MRLNMIPEPLLSLTCLTTGPSFLLQVHSARKERASFGGIIELKSLIVDLNGGKILILQVSHHVGYDIWRLSPHQLCHLLLGSGNSSLGGREARFCIVHDRRGVLRGQREIETRRRIGFYREVSQLINKICKYTFQRFQDSCEPWVRMVCDDATS
jgi:hypothetical protein